MVSPLSGPGWMTTVAGFEIEPRSGASEIRPCSGVIAILRGEDDGMSVQDAGVGIELSEAIALLRDELLKARAAGADADIQLPVESMTVELSITATKSKDGKAGFTVPLVGIQLGGSGHAEHGSDQKVTVVFGTPVDRHGRHVKVASASDTPKG